MKDKEQRKITKERRQALPYSQESAVGAACRRIPWLLILMLSATLTGVIISAYESALSTSVYLTAYIPMLMGTGGNAGSQASVTVIRAFSCGAVTGKDSRRILSRELRIAALCALVLGGVAFLKTCLFDAVLMHTIPMSDMLPLASTVSLSLILTVLFAKLIGAWLPLLAFRIRLDPAVMVSPFITTLVDTVSLVLYFQIAKLFIPGI